MRFPDNNLRSRVSSVTSELRVREDEEAEEGLYGVLGEILDELQSELDTARPDDLEANAEDVISACHAWASLASHAVAAVYAPNSPFPRNMAGWGNRVIKRLEQISKILRSPLSIAARSLGAQSYSISVGFPWGVSIGFSWGRVQSPGR